jgi:phosphatidylserine/phosphatidylglycerophosphate/cardiolipin synthase-like enzyme
MALHDLSVLDKYKTGGFPPDFSAARRVFFAPVDDVHGALVDLISSAESSLIVALYGFDDEELANVIRDKLQDPKIVVYLTLDSSQAGGVHEREILAAENYPASSIAIGRSEKNQIMHLKAGVVDGVNAFTGSTNWSHSGEALQDNELTVVRDRAEAHMVRTRIDAIHASMLAKAKATARG